MEFVNNLNNLIVDDQYFMDVPVVQGPSNVPTGNIGLLGTFSRGPVNTPVLVTSYQDAIKKFNNVDTAFTLTGPIGLRTVFQQGNANVYVVRVQSSTTPAANATVALKDTQATPGTVMTLNAFTPGTWGNSLTVTVSAGTKANTFKVQLVYGSESETWDNLIIQQPATPIQGAVLASAVFGTGSTGGQSLLSYATFPGTANTNAWATGTFTMSGGTDGAPTASSDYVGSNTGGTKTGLYALDSSPVNYVFCAEQTDASINSALQTNAANITQSGGTPRKAIVAVPRSTQASGLQTLIAALDSDRIIPTWLFQQVYDPVTNQNQVVSPLGFMAGLLAQLKPHQTPSNKQIFGTLGVDPNMIIGPSDIATAMQAHCNIIGVRTPAFSKGVMGGWTASQTAGDSQQLYVRAMKDYIDSLVFTIGGQYVDAPITPDLWRQIKQSVDNILYPMKKPTTAADQMIADYKITCDSSNNPSNVTQQNMVVCDYAVKLLNINRWLIFRTQISPGVVITSTSQGQ